MGRNSRTIRTPKLPITATSIMIHMDRGRSKFSARDSLMLRFSSLALLGLTPTSVSVMTLLLTTVTSMETMNVRKRKTLTPSL